MNLPEDFVTKYTRLLGDEAPAFFASYDLPAHRAFRINPLKEQEKLSDTNAQGQLPYGKWGYLGGVAGHSVDHVTGLVYSQEPSAQFVGEVLAPQPGETVLDLAAAPGGKTTHLASFMQQKGLLWTNEIFMNRAKILSENVERWGVENAVVSSQSPDQLAKRLPEFFDKILLDAPCSGEGMFRKDPAAMQYWSEDYPAECASRQREILTETVKMLKPGGTLVYSTCTFAPEEDEQMVAWLLENYPEFEIDPIEKPADSGIQDGRSAWSNSTIDMSGTARLWPQDLPGEGHFVARLKKRQEEGGEAAQIKAFKPANLPAEQKVLLKEFLAATCPGLTCPADRLTLFGDHLFLVPAGTPDLTKFKILRAGLALGTFKKKRFEPDQALALALHPSQVSQSYALDENDWARYVHGDVIQTDSDLQKGWVLMTANGNGVGWAKYSAGQLKNFYPKGLRFLVQKDKA
ncbi:RsmB/NOP family class I SAM-dependent RNA methyltransferase [Eupransor demetentiae]|uniref:NOL1/NOP2/FMU family (Ncl1) n=1 Tax=Eupransor demetentiae TaxID=3109584 RepID=A0ABM9N4I5_9LACO|nr:NOL1/NOP2/FMU family (Ncl1) [Lactobacillaceae bacterium LMG 33000]